MEPVDSRSLFERNLNALSRRNPELCAWLSAAGLRTAPCRYRFLEARSGDTVPALIDGSGVARSLHSTMDPKREAERLLSAANDAGFVVFLGLGAGIVPLEALNLPGTSGVLVIDYDIAGIAELFRVCDYAGLLGDSRCTLLVDPAPALVESAVLELYRPALSGGIRVLPLRARVEQDRGNFGAAGEAVRRGIEKVSSDYSVQAHFGMRWFGNIIRNVMAVPVRPHDALDLSPPREAVICAAGPSLDMQIPLLLERKGQGRGRPFVISTDTALPALVRRGLTPDAVVSIDCQHISYYHFMDSVCRKIPLFLDIASPPLLSALSDFPIFFSGGHPLAMYLRQKWMSLPVLDTSGGNVTFACLSLAESLGARRVTVCGADFSYPAGKIYAKGTYVFPYFERRQNRLSPLEAQVSAFLFRSPFLPDDSAESPAGLRRYEMATMRSYRLSFERKVSEVDVEVSVMPGLGIPPVIRRNPLPRSPGNNAACDFALGKPAASAVEFLEGYRRDIDALPPMCKERETSAYLQGLNADAEQVFTTLLPQMAALKHRRPELSPSEVFDAVKRYCIDEIGRTLNSYGTVD